MMGHIVVRLFEYLRFALPPPPPFCLVQRCKERQRGTSVLALIHSVSDLLIVREAPLMTVEKKMSGVV